MANSYIEFKKFSVHKRGQADDSEQLDSISDENIDILDHFHDFLNVQKENEVIQFDKIDADLDMSKSTDRPVDLKKANRKITGLGIQGKKGERKSYYTEGNSINQDSIFEQRPPHSGRAYFYYLLYIPIGSTVGFAIFQKRGNESIARTLTPYLKAKFQDAVDGYILDFENHFPNEIVESWLENGEIREIKGYKVASPNELEKHGLISEKPFKIGFSIKTVGLKRTKKIEQLLKKNEFGFSGKIFNSIGIEDDQNIHSVKITQDGQTKVIKLGEKPGSSSSLKIEDQKWEDNLQGYRIMGAEIDEFFRKFIQRPLQG